MGPATRDKLGALGIGRVADVRARSKAALQRELGGKTGASVRAHNIKPQYTLEVSRNFDLLIFKVLLDDL